MTNYRNELETTRLRMQYGLQSNEEINRTLGTLHQMLSSNQTNEIKNLSEIINKLIDSKSALPQISLNVNQAINVEFREQWI